MATLILNRLSGIITSGPSFMVNVSIINSLLLSNRGTMTQKVSIAACLVSFVVDFLILYTLSKWFVDKTWADFTKFVVALAVLKRLYSTVTVYVTFLRFKAISGSTRLTETHARIYAGVYFLLSVATAALHFSSYQAVRWNSGAARESMLFKIYRYSNLIATSYFVFFGVWVDIAFIRAGKTNPYIYQAFNGVRHYYNVRVYIAYEIALYLIFIISIIWSTFDIDVTGSVYVEQVLLSFMMCNGTYLVQVVIDRSVFRTTSGVTTNLMSERQPSPTKPSGP